MLRVEWRYGVYHIYPDQSANQQKNWNLCKRNIKNIAFRKPTHNVFLYPTSPVDWFLLHQKSVTAIGHLDSSRCRWRVFVKYKACSIPPSLTKNESCKIHFGTFENMQLIFNFHGCILSNSIYPGQQKRKNTNLLQKISETLDLYPFIF